MSARGRGIIARWKAVKTGMRMIVLCCATLLACGGDAQATPEEQLQGKWFLDEGGCVRAFTFEETSYEMDLICPLNDGSHGVELVVGEFAVNDGSIEFDPQRASCDDVDGAPFAWSYKLDGDSLRLVSPAGILILEGFEDSEGATHGSAQFGCFADDGRFAPSVPSTII